MDAILNALGFTFIFITLILWGFFALGVRSSYNTSVAEFMLAGVFSSIPIFLSACSFIAATNVV